MEGPEVFTDPDGHTNTQTLAWEKNRLTHRKIAAKTANLQGIIWYSQELTERVLETLAMQKTERAVDIQPRKCHWY